MSETTRPKNTEYLKKRLEELGISEKQNTFTREWISEGSKLENGKTVPTKTLQKRDYQIFDADEDGNIVIRYFNLNGQPYQWKKEDTKWSREFIRKRLRQPKGDMKYWQEAGSGQYPFFNPGIIEKYKRACVAALVEEQPVPEPKINKLKKKKGGSASVESKTDDGAIDTLFIVEGEFKSFKGWMSGLDIIGLPSIHGFYNGDVKGKLHEDIQEVIVKCRVRKIVFLVDADLFTVKWAEDKDLYKRPASFYGSIKAFRESLQMWLEEGETKYKMIYFMAIKLKFLNEAKGLDDLLCKYSSVHMEIIQDLLEFQFAKKYFDGWIINDLSKDVQGKMFKILGLSDEQEFYKTYGEFIGSREFKFKRRKYIYDQESKEVKFVKHEDAEKFMRVGPDWFKVISKLNKHGEIEEEIVPWKVGEIERDYPRKRFPSFIDDIPKYDGFCNEPSWNGEYKSSVQGCFNLCRPLKHIPKEGGISATINFLKHIFQGAAKVILDENGNYISEEPIMGDPFTVILDYLTIMYRFPKQMLPVPILVSKENNTGKSTFLKWLQQIYGSNMAILGNQQFQMKFNSHYITKFIIAIDEGFLDVDKKAEKERLKQLVTSDTQFLEFKGANVKQFTYYGKVVICSNDADSVMKIEDGESRWFVVKVPVIQKKDPDLELKLKSEVAAWLHFLKNRPIFHPRADRLWFKAEDFITDQLKVIVETTKSRLDRVFEDWIREQFFLYRLATLKYSISQLADFFNDFKNNKYKVDKIELRAYLQRRKVAHDKRPQKFKYPNEIDIPEGGLGDTRIIMKESSPTHPYIFNIEDWLTKDEIESLEPLTDPVTLILRPAGQVNREGITINHDDLPF